MGCTASSNSIDYSATSSDQLDVQPYDSVPPISLLDSLHGVQLMMNKRAFVTENCKKDINELYLIDYNNVLGTGISGTVCLGVHRATQIQYAIKMLNKKEVKAEKLQQLSQEIKIMINLDHPNILRLIECFETTDQLFLVLELCKGGELLERLHAQEECKFPEKVVCRYIYTILSAVRYCHKHSIIHRDLKLENFLFDTSSEDSELKLIDFGLSQFFSSHDQIFTQSCGTPYYVAPEVLSGYYNCKCDVWSIGIITYMLLSGSPPFYGKSDAETLRSVKSGHWRFNENSFRNISADAKSFITMCLQRPFTKRPSADEAILHKWFRIMTSTTSAVEKIDSSNGSQEVSSTAIDVIERMKKFGSRSSIAKIFLEVLSHTLSAGQIEDLRREFFKIGDARKNGNLCMQSMRDTFQGQNNPLSTDELQLIFDGVDYEKSGIIYFHEFLAATIEPSSISSANLQLAFEKISMQQSTITEASLLNVLGADATAADVEELVVEAGLNNGAPLAIGLDYFVEMITHNIILSPCATSPYTRYRKRFAFDSV